MKKTWRPRCAAYYFLYCLCIPTIADTIFTSWRLLSGDRESMAASFAPFSYLVTAMALIYAYAYARTRVTLSGGELNVRSMVDREPKKGEKRTIILFRQGSHDLEFWDKTFLLSDVVRWGYCEDLKVPRVDQSNATEKDRFMPVHEIAFILKGEKRCHVNIAVYGKKHTADFVKTIRQETGLEPEGKLKEFLA